MSSLFKRIKSLVTSDDTEKKTTCRAKGKGKKLNAPCDFAFTFPCTARNSSSISVLTSRTDDNINKSSFIEKADYEAEKNYVKNSNDEINLISDDQLLLIHFNKVTDFALVKNLRSKKIGFVPISAIVVKG